MMMMHFSFVVLIREIIEMRSIRSAFSIVLLGPKGIQSGGKVNKIAFNIINNIEGGNEMKNIFQQCSFTFLICN